MFLLFSTFHPKFAKSSDLTTWNEGVLVGPISYEGVLVGPISFELL